MKTMLKKSLLGMILVVLIGTPALGVDMQAGKWWRNPRLSKELKCNRGRKGQARQSLLGQPEKAH